MYPTVKNKSRTYSRPASGAPQAIDLYADFQLADSIIWGITLIIRGTMTSGGGGAITGFHRDAPAGMITNVVLSGGYDNARGRRELVNAPTQQLFYPGNFSSGIFHALLRTSAGAASTDPFRATIPLPLRDPAFGYSDSVYIDVRDYNSFDLDIRNWATDASLATTNVSTVQAVELEVQIDLVDNGPPQGSPHFEPSLAYKELPASSVSTRLTDNGQLSWDGFAVALWMQQHDDSGAGDAERVNGLVRRLIVEQRGMPRMDNVSWDQLLRNTWAKYNPSLTTTEVAGVAGYTFDPPLDAVDGPGFNVRDTSSANPPGITDIVATTSDALFSLIVAAEPVYGAEKWLR